MSAHVHPRRRFSRIALHLAIAASVAADVAAIAGDGSDVSTPCGVTLAGLTANAPGATIGGTFGPVTARLRYSPLPDPTIPLPVVHLQLDVAHSAGRWSLELGWRSCVRHPEGSEGPPYLGATETGIPRYARDDTRMTIRCMQCGATFAEADRSCAERFSALLALDHSRQEPWGSRHGRVFAAYVLEHPAEHTRAQLEQAWVALYRVYDFGDDPARVFTALRRGPVQTSRWNVPPLPAEPVRRGKFDVTIADLGDFDPDGYGERVDAWCRAALRGWGAALGGAAR